MARLRRRDERPAVPDDPVVRAKVESVRAKAEHWDARADELEAAGDGEWARSLRRRASGLRWLADVIAARPERHGPSRGIPPGSCQERHPGAE